MEQVKKDFILSELSYQNQNLDSEADSNLKHFLSSNFKPVLRYRQKHLALTSASSVLEVYFLRIFLSTNLEKLVFEEKLDSSESFPIVFYNNLFKRAIGSHPTGPVDISSFEIFLENDGQNYLSHVTCNRRINSSDQPILNSFI
jgi:hypothetical protein